jgi:hypothetical protein
LTDVKEILAKAVNPVDIKAQLIEEYPYYDERLLIDICIPGLFKSKTKK